MNAIILRTIPYQENAKLLYAYTTKGHISFIGRGLYKMNSPLKIAADPYKLIDIEISERKLPTLKSVKLIAHYPKTKENYEKTLMPHIIGETILKNVTEDDDHPKLFSLLIKTLEGIEQSEDGFDFLALFMFKLLYFLGFGLGVGACHACGAKDNLGYIPRDFKTVCEAHGANQDDQMLYDTLVTWLKAEAFDYQAMPRDTVFKRQIFALIMSLYDEHLDFTAKSFAAYQSYLKESL